MPSSRFFTSALSQFQSLPPIPQSLSVSYLKTVFEKTRRCSHIAFLRTCLRQRTVPKGFQLKFHPVHGNTSPSTQFNKILLSTSRRLMISTVQQHNNNVNQLSSKLFHLRTQLRDLCDLQTSNFIIRTTRQANEDLYISLQSTKAKKMATLCLKSQCRPSHPSPTDPIDPPTQHHLVVTVPEDLPLSNDEKSLLARGLQFVPLQPRPNWSMTLFHCQRFFRRLRLAAHFQDTDSPNAPTVNGDPSDIASLFPKASSSWTPKSGSFSSLDYYISTCSEEIEQLRLKPLKHSNISQQEKLALINLKQRTDIVIKPADKGGAVVVWQKDKYLAEAQRQLSDTTSYQPIPSASIKHDNAIIRKTIKQAISQHHLPTEASHAIISEPTEPQFYLLPKIHKTNTPGRPIVSACSCPTTQISQFLDGIFQPLVASLPTYIKDTNHALQLFHDFSFPADTSNRFLFTMDIVSLYTNIPHHEGLTALKHFLPRSSYDINITVILRLAELVLNLNSFSFAGQHFNQIKGVAMGTRMGPSYACLFVGFVEEQIFSAFPGHLPVFFRRFIDDCMGITCSSKTELMDFISFVSSFHPSLKFTFEISESSLPFLDIQLSILPDSDHLTTSVFYKPTDSHSYLMYSSSHPKATRDSIPFSQLLRLRRLCSNEPDFTAKSEEMISFFHIRGYPQDLLDRARESVSRISRSEALSPKDRKEQENRIPLPIPYHPHNLSVKNILLRNFHLLQQDPRLKQVFPKPPLVAFKRDKNLRDHLVRSKFRVNRDEPAGNFPCNKPKCKTCPFIVNLTSITGPSGNFSVKSHFNCLSSNIVYALQCSLCNKIYIGETYRTLNERFTEHLRSIRLQYPTPVSAHFNSENHNEKYVQITAIYQNFSSGIHRKFMESTLIARLGTVVPNGLNTHQ